MLSFYPGPSKVHPQSLEFIQEAYRRGIVSINHRSKTFESLYEDTEEVLKSKWGIPSNYSIYFISSATEAWDIISHSLVIKQSVHFFNGSFGQKWAQYNRFWHPNAINIDFPIQQHIGQFLKETIIDYSHADAICFVQSETSNASGQIIKRSMFSQQTNALIAVDATSSMGGIELPWEEADVWFASVQKCLGLPAGMAVLICSPKALEQAAQVGKKNKYNNLLFMEVNRKKWQTHYTPNVLGIFLLNRLSHHLPNLKDIHEQTLAKSQFLFDFFGNQFKKSCDFLIEDVSLRLPTVCCLKNTEFEIQRLLLEAEKKGIILGKGYGEWAKNTFRIANFPSHTMEDFHKLTQFITSHGF